MTARMPTAVALATVLGAGLLSAIATPPAHPSASAVSPIRVAGPGPGVVPPAAWQLLRAQADPAGTPASSARASPTATGTGTAEFTRDPAADTRDPAADTGDPAADTAADTGPRGAATIRPVGSNPTTRPARKRASPVVAVPRRSVSPRPSATRSPILPASASPTASKSPAGSGAIHGWITTADGSRRVAPLTPADLTPGGGGSESLTVDPSKRYQSLAGTGAALTESSAHLLMQLPAATRSATLRQLFDPGAGAGVSLLRLPLGASDFALSAYTYDDNPTGGTDPSLTHESVAHDDAEIVPIVKAALAINPALTIVATPWSAPAWMKTSGSLDGGSLISGEEQLYAHYLAIAVAQLRNRGVPITAVTVDDEPENAQPGGSPTMAMSEPQEATVVQDTRSLLSSTGGSGVEILGYDHNWSDPSYPEELLASPTTAAALGGTAWHCYGGDPSAQLAVAGLHPDKEIWETECSGGDFSPDFSTNLAYDIQTLGITGTRDGSRSVLLWNLALDPGNGPHDGGCTDCRGVVTIDPATGAVTRNVEYDVLALLGSARPGAVRIDAGQPSGIGSEAWLNPDGSRTLLLDNTNAGGSATIGVTVTEGSTTATVQVPGGAAVSLVWG